MPNAHCTLLYGDCRTILPTLDAGSVQTIVTSPPYWRLRRYIDDPAEIGQEDTLAAYVAALVAVFVACRRVLRDDGTLWLNLGDCYADDRKWGGSTSGKHASGLHGKDGPGRRKVTTGLPPKSLMGLPWRVAFALQEQGWVLRNEIIWHRPNAMPEGHAPDRADRAHETVFLFSKTSRYWFDKTGVGNSKTVWSIPVGALRTGHMAPMPEKLAERCILAGSRTGDLVLDPFAGSGTTLRAALALGRRAVGIDLAYQDLQAQRTDGVQVVLPFAVPQIDEEA